MATPVSNRSSAWDALLGAVHAWQLQPSEVRSRASRNTWLSRLSDDERSQYERFETDEMREQYLAGHALCRAMLSRYTGVNPSEWRFRIGAQGKPAVAAPERFASLRFNLTHTDNLVVCAVSRAGEVGVDAEDTSRPIDTALLARHFLTAPEAAFIESLGRPQRAARFFEQWVLKEAFVKALGDGLGNVPERLMVGQRENGRPVGIGNWQFFISRPSACHVAAAAVLRRDSCAPVSIYWIRASLTA